MSETFPQQHKHPFEEDYHDHHPFHPEREDHSHPHYFNGYAGAELLWSRLEFIEIAYPLALIALMGDGARWTLGGRPRRLLSWRWVRHSRLVNAVATYEDGYRLFFCWVGRSVTVPMLRWRAERFQEEHQRLQRAHQVSFPLITSSVNADEDLSENAGGDLTHQVLFPLIPSFVLTRLLLDSGIAELELTHLAATVQRVHRLPRGQQLRQPV